MWGEKNINAYLAVFFTLLVLGFLLHQDPGFAGSLPGHLLGIIGAILILMTLIYPFRKRILKKKGKTESAQLPHYLRTCRRFARCHPLGAQVGKHHRYSDFSFSCIGGVKRHYRPLSLPEGQQVG